MMGFFSKSDIPECEAMFKSGIVKAVNVVDVSLDVEIDNGTYEDIPVHYHCEDGWKEHSHPHSSSDREMMLSAFSIDDEVNVICNGEGAPLYVTGFTQNPKQCIGGPFLTANVIKIAKDVWNPSLYESDYRYYAEGNFYGMKEGGGYGTPVTASGHQAEFKGLLTGAKLYVNGVYIAGGKWTHDSHYALTGEPATWKITGPCDQFYIKFKQPSGYGYENHTIFGARIYLIIGGYNNLEVCNGAGESQVCYYSSTYIAITDAGGDSNVKADYIDFAESKVGVWGATFDKIAGDYIAECDGHVGCQGPGFPEHFPYLDANIVHSPHMNTLEGSAGHAKYRGAHLGRENGNIYWQYEAELSSCEYTPLTGQVEVKDGTLPDKYREFGTPDHQYKELGDLSFKFQIEDTQAEEVFDLYGFTKLENDITVAFESHYKSELLSF